MNWTLEMNAQAILASTMQCAMTVWVTTSATVLPTGPGRTAMSTTLHLRGARADTPIR